MDERDLLLVVALGTITVAAAAALVADRPPRHSGHFWRYPMLVTATAAVNIGLTVAVASRPQPLTGTIVLGCALLLVYAVYRRARAADIHRAPRRRRHSRHDDRDLRRGTPDHHHPRCDESDAARRRQP